MNLDDIEVPSAIRAAINEYDSVGRTYFLEKYGFAKSRDYMLRDAGTGRLYDSKAIVGAAYRYAFPEKGTLPASQFPDDEASVPHLLTKLGFEVVRIGQDWSDQEIKAAVDDYFEMLRLEARQAPFNKSDHNEHLRHKLTARSRGSVEMKHQNISAILNQLGLPYIRGYKPRSNYQDRLQEIVIAQVRRESDLLQTIVDDIQAQTEPGNQAYQGVLISRPEPPVYQPFPKRERIPRKLDYVARDEHNRKLGRNGEHWALGYEQSRLQNEHRADLASKVDWVSERIGDGAGYDIMSFEMNDVARFIEVKTTNGGSLTPFIVSRNELDFSEEIEDAFCLYRVFNFALKPQLFILRGDLSNSVHLNPIDYRARLKQLLD